jgi:hypothetical protein
MSPRRLSAFLTFTMLVLTALAGCGSNDDDLLSTASATELRSTLTRVQQNIEQGDCSGAQAEASTLQQQVTALDHVETKLKNSLAAGARRLKTLVVQKCEAPLAATGPTGPAQPEEGTTGEEGDQGEQPGKAKGKNKEKNPKKHESQGQGEDNQGDQTGGSGGGTTGSEGTIP